MSLVPLVIFLAILPGTSRSALCQGNADAEARFIAMLKGATLQGTWAPIQQGRLGAEKGDDTYRIARVEKVEDGAWSIVSVFNVRDREVEFPIRAEVKFAGDTAVLILDNVRAGGGSANWSARVMFHDDVYAGRWWETEDPEHGGTIAGTITRDESVEAEKSTGADQSEKLYELRFYTTNDGKLPALHQRFRNHTLRLFEKHGMENVIYWTVEEGARGEEEIKDNMLVYIISHRDKASHDASWDAFLNDPEWQRVAEESEKDGKILAEPPRSILMTATDFSAEISPRDNSDAEPRLFELRQYNDGPDRLPSTVDRFASGEKDLFTKHGMETVGFWTATDNSAFIYLLAHQDRDAARESWQAFFPEFREFLEGYRSRSRSEQPEPAAQADAQRSRQRRGGGFEVRFLRPTDYSPHK
jgi:hypothetical protein